MHEFPVRKTIRMQKHDYSMPGAYFITVCTANRDKIFWDNRRGDLWSPENVPLSEIGIITNREIQKLNSVYTAVQVDKYCIMPDHIHMILTIDTAADGRTQFAPTVSRVMKQFKGSITKQIGRSVWQKSFMSMGSGTNRIMMRSGNIFTTIPENMPCKRHRDTRCLLLLT
jgi:REP element-mobilizing transposase RayT